MKDTDAVSADNPQKRRRYKRNTGVFRGVDLAPSGGDESGNSMPTTSSKRRSTTTTWHQSAALKVAKLQVIVERLQNEALQCGKHNQQLGSGISSASSHTHSAVKPTRLGE
jgi:hypothetical protein